MNHVQLLQQIYPAAEARALYRWVMEERFGLSQAQLLMGKDTELSADERKELDIIVRRMAKGEPVQYVLGYTTFRNSRFKVSPSVLIPRPETQELVALALREHPASCRMLDIGTGSGCIAISLALEGHEVWACDVSADALRVAEENARRLLAAVTFCQTDVLVERPFVGTRFHAIVSNPPYICQRERAEMHANVLEHEPHLALFVPDADPLLFYRRITRLATEALEEGGSLYFECNRAYAREVAEEMRKAGFVAVEVHKDMFENERFVSGQLG